MDNLGDEFKRLDNCIDNAAVWRLLADYVARNRDAFA